MFCVCFQRQCDTEGCVCFSQRYESDHFRFALRKRSGLVEYYSREPPGCLQRFAISDEDTITGCVAQPQHE